MTTSARARWVGGVRPLVLGLALACTSACGEPPADPEPPPAEPPPADALEARARELGREAAPYMIRDGDPRRGDLPEDGARDVDAVLRPGFCYKIFALGDEGLNDIDLRVHSPEGLLLERDVTDHDHPVLGTYRPICPVETGQFRIELRAADGAGPFLVQVYRSI